MRILSCLQSNLNRPTTSKENRIFSWRFFLINEKWLPVTSHALAAVIYFDNVCLNWISSRPLNNIKWQWPRTSYVSSIREIHEYFWWRHWNENPTHIFIFSFFLGFLSSKLMDDIDRRLVSTCWMCEFRAIFEYSKLCCRIRALFPQTSRNCKNVEFTQTRTGMRIIFTKRSLLFNRDWS